MDKEILETKIFDLEPTIRTYNCLRRIGVETLGDLVKLTPSEVRAIPHISQKCVYEILSMVNDLGLELKEE